MVLPINRQYHLVNKFIVSFLTSCDEKNQDLQLVQEWKRVGSSKLKSIMQRGVVQQPKRVISKYLYFCAEERPKILAEKKMPIKEVTCELGRRWKKFLENPDPERMETYQKLFDQDKDRYMTERIPVEKKRAAPNSAYLNFCAEQRKLEPKIRMKELGVMWAVVKQNPDEYKKYEVVAN